MSWLMNCWLVTMLIWPACLAVWAVYSSKAEYINFVIFYNHINKKLLKLAPSYSLGTYNQSQLLSILNHTEGITTDYDSLRTYVWIVLVSYLISIIILALSYIPVMAFVLKVLIDAKALKLWGQRPELSSMNRDATSQILETLRQQREKIVWHTIWVYIGTLCFVPVVVWALILSVEDQGFWFDSHWWNGLETGLHVPISIVGNM
ncbi:hypothetical protein CROQUDRAFT_214476 [Cronartium quercuum f. sp. fusiforme G11]|uniref:Uncharacterized protein n=1 Tax=Cronartium quercuum f. sp. fusiforme G11 TaxID=708437 RepID=A0A9P6TFF5_9BASI|nr:hypothetical protein CROQUDRAFT_214476 [Cronartium quercuum f. sp. fusiforme G11]